MSLSNTTTRVLVAVVAIPLILLICYLGGYYFFLFILAIALLSFHELFVIAKNKKININLWIGFLSIILIHINNFRNFIDFYYLTILIVVLTSLFELFRNKGSAIENIGATLLGIFYIGLFTASIVGIRNFYPDVGNLYLRGAFLIISILASIWICDSAAYFGGISLGKHKLFPRVSPNKSWEGAIFGFLFAILSMILAKIIILDFLQWNSIIIIGVIVGTVGQLGDLIESLLKRDAGVKDSSALIPGHGGIFDRFDSLIYIAPVVLIYLNYFGR